MLTDDGMLQGPSNPKSIDIHSPPEMRHWARELSQPAKLIIQAVEAVGPVLSDVRDYLRKNSLYGRIR